MVGLVRVTHVSSQNSAAQGMIDSWAMGTPLLRHPHSHRTTVAMIQLGSVFRLCGPDFLARLNASLTTEYLIFTRSPLNWKPPKMTNAYQTSKLCTCAQISSCHHFDLHDDQLESSIRFHDHHQPTPRGRYCELLLRTISNAPNGQQQH